jgi:hypothetical protein
MIISKKPVVQSFNVEADPEGKLTVEIRQANFNEDMRRADLVARQRLVRSDERGNETAIEQDYNVEEARAVDIYLTLSGLEGITDEDGKEVKLVDFVDRGGVRRIKGSQQSFFEAIGRLPTPVIREIHKYVLEVNPQWDPNAEGE